MAQVLKSIAIPLGSFDQHPLKSGKKKQHKHKLFGPDFPRTFLTLTPGRPWVKQFLPITGAAEKRTFWCGRPRFLARTSMTRRVVEKLCTKKVCVDFLAPMKGGFCIRGLCHHDFMQACVERVQLTHAQGQGSRSVLYMGKMGSICHFPRALPASIWGHCSQILVFTSIWGTQKGV